jgi:ketosteroid isomerase-like protein
MSQELVETVHRSLDAWTRGDVDAWLEPSHPEVEWISDVARRVEGTEIVYRGVAGLRRYWDDWHAVWNVSIEVTESIDLDDTVLTLAKVRTHGGASGIDLQREIAFVFEFEDGLIRRARAYYEPGEAFEAVGLDSAP